MLQATVMHLFALQCFIKVCAPCAAAELVAYASTFAELAVHECSSRCESFSRVLKLAECLELDDLVCSFCCAEICR